MSQSKRPLTDDELMVLRLIQEAWGPQNTSAKVLFMKSPGAAEAWIFIEAANGSQHGAVNLTNTSAWYRDGTFSYDDLLRAVHGPDWPHRHGT